MKRSLKLTDIGIVCVVLLSWLCVSCYWFVCPINVLWCPDCVSYYCFVCPIIVLVVCVVLMFWLCVLLLCCVPYYCPGCVCRIIVLVVCVLLLFGVSYYCPCFVCPIIVPCVLLARVVHCRRSLINHQEIHVLYGVVIWSLIAVGDISHRVDGSVTKDSWSDR